MIISNTSETENTPYIDNSIKSVSDLLYILQDGVPIKFDKDKIKLVKVGDKIYANPTTEQLKAAGYKPLALPDRPPDIEGYYISEHYYNDGDKIVKSYQYEKITEDLYETTD